MKIVLWVLVVEALGIASGLLTASSIPTWYASLQRPPGNPPNWVFGPVWTALYAMMGTSGALIWHRRDGSRALMAARRWFVAQLVLNLAWTPVFFGAHWMAVALAVIVGLLVAIGMTMRKAWPVNRLASLLLAPYFLWVSYATYLNAGYWLLNR